jgi:hypothetical protein
VGTFWICNSGLKSPSSQVNFFGIAPPSLNDGLVIIMVVNSSYWIVVIGNQTGYYNFFCHPEVIKDDGK